MKTLFVGLAVLALVCAGWAQSDNFHITVTVNQLGVTLYQDDGTTPYGTWALGNMGTTAGAVMSYDTPDADGDDHVEAKNTGNCTANLSIYSTTPAPAACGFGTPTAWTAGAAVGADIYLLTCSQGDETTTGGSFVTCDQMASPGTQVASSVAAGATAHLFFGFTTPSSVSDGCQHDITVTVLASTP